MKLPVKIIILSCCFMPFALLALEPHASKASSSLADHIPSTKSTNPKDKGWLANLKGLPTREEIEELSKHVDDVMKLEKNKACTSINPRLRKMIFLHFATYQHLVNARGVYLTEKNIHHWAHVFGMLLKESSGDPTSVTAMSGRTFTNYQAKSDLDRWRKIVAISKKGNIPFNKQTNFGLTQLSVDRLFVALQLAQTPAFLPEGLDKDDLDTAVAIRRLIWFYQDFAQGRLTQEHDRIHYHERGNPEYSTRFAFGTSMALLLCGTHYMYYEGFHEKATGMADLADAMSSIAYCHLGNSHDGYGMTKVNAMCFAKWVTLCPTLNFDIAMLTPPEYFATRNAAPVCEGTFKALLTKKPVAVEKASPNKHRKEPAKTAHHQDTNSKNTPSGFGVKKLLKSASTLITDFFDIKKPTSNSTDMNLQH